MRATFYYYYYYYYYYYSIQSNGVKMGLLYGMLSGNKIPDLLEEKLHM